LVLDLKLLFKIYLVFLFSTAAGTVAAGEDCGDAALTSFF